VVERCSRSRDSASVVHAAKLHFLDALGCGLAAHALGIATAGREDDASRTAESRRRP